MLEHQTNLNPSNDEILALYLGGATLQDVCVSISSRKPLNISSRTTKS